MRRVALLSVLTFIAGLSTAQGQDVKPRKPEAGRKQVGKGLPANPEGGLLFGLLGCYFCNTGHFWLRYREYTETFILTEYNSDCDARCTGCACEETHTQGPRDGAKEGSDHAQEVELEGLYEKAVKTQLQGGLKLKRADIKGVFSEEVKSSAGGKTKITLGGRNTHASNCEIIYFYGAVVLTVTYTEWDYETRWAGFVLRSGTDTFLDSATLSVVNFRTIEPCVCKKKDKSHGMVPLIDKKMSSSELASQVAGQPYAVLKVQPTDTIKVNEAATAFTVLPDGSIGSIPIEPGTLLPAAGIFGLAFTTGKFLLTPRGDSGSGMSVNMGGNSPSEKSTLGYFSETQDSNMVQTAPMGVQNREGFQESAWVKDGQKYDSNRPMAELLDKDLRKVGEFVEQRPPKGALEGGRVGTFENGKENGSQEVKGKWQDGTLYLEVVPPTGPAGSTAKMHVSNTAGHASVMQAIALGGFNPASQLKFDYQNAEGPRAAPYKDTTDTITFGNKPGAGQVKVTTDGSDPKVAEQRIEEAKKTHM